ncbi:hypothetical protein [Klebsiella pneumoniae]|uniref:hypothetical protein n=1 Tax=Klebsiella pneumoniae TaxID=573 RepID=UPI0022B6C530|nr:hypothetical protein [Klebsiella pneumoniae]
MTGLNIKLCHLLGSNLPPVPDASDFAITAGCEILFYDERLLLRLLHYPSFANAGRHGKVFRSRSALDKRQRVSESVSGFPGRSLVQSQRLRW